ncbi:hypothetical protein BDV25DRAFT_165227 [Aspergillus avenaceus]|uniref:Uncharacterized protein n=1 Tax=Aspergillus avenaceus TaxID=36643 RepID=A0A5N6TFN1_ASPAV|nr:hypothetical protein BDV25DRAFT_165227 [Aspergillus avenaceus]
MLTSSSDTSSSGSNSPISQHPHPQAYFPVPRRREPARCPRYYSTPLKADLPESTPLQVYGLEQREPSIYGEMRQSKLLRRFSHALDDIKEDFSLQLDPRTTTDKIRSKRRQSTLMLDTSAPGSRNGSISGGESPMSSEPPRPRPMSVFSSAEHLSPPTRRLSRRLTMLGFSRKHRVRGSQTASISQPNLIGSSTQM